MKEFDKIIIGSGIYGLYAAHESYKKNEKVLILEYDDNALLRGSYVNQARVHNGYHYPRSYSTAIKSSNYFQRFNEDYAFAVHNTFEKIYATSANYSWTNQEQFIKFCKNANIRCDEINPNKYFKNGLVDGAYITKEFTFDAGKIRDYYVETLKGKVDIKYSARIDSILAKGDKYIVRLENGSSYSTPYVLNATYASVNQILDKMGFEKFKIKYELCEIIRCNTSDNISNVGITVMDGPFFSVMPFGLTGEHSLTSVTFTPHLTSYDKLPTFGCQENEKCSPSQLENCNLCESKPKTAWSYMSNLAKKYLNDNIDLNYLGSLYSMKPILMASEMDDSRPTVIRVHSENPTFVSVLSGKINTIYDLDEVL